MADAGACEASAAPIADADGAAGAACTEEPTSGAAVAALSSADVAAAGDFVVLWCSYTQVASLVLQHGSITNNKLGSFHHDDLIGLPFGTRVHPRKPGERGDLRWVALLRPSPELITDSLVHRTQIIYHADISLLLSLLDVCPGKVIVEAGTGSGSVSASLARALRPGGRLHTFEFHAERQRLAAEDFRRYGVDDVVVSRHADVCNDGFGEGVGKVDGVFLDLPAPWLALPHVDACLVPGGRICTFSPCIEQIDRTATELRRRRYQNVRVFESLAVGWAVRAAGSSNRKRPRTGGGSGDARRKKGKGGKKGAAADLEEKVECDVAEEAAGEVQPTTWLSHQLPMRGHTSFLLIATRPPEGEPV